MPIPSQVREVPSALPKVYVGAASDLGRRYGGDWLTVEMVADNPGALELFPAVKDSAFYMNAERLQRYADTRQLPLALASADPVKFSEYRYYIGMLTAADLTNASKLFAAAHSADLLISARQFIKDAENLAANRPLVRDYISPDGIPPYDSERIALWKLEREFKLLKAQEAAALDALAKMGASPIQLAAISQTATATDPVTTVLNQANAANLLTNQSPVSSGQAQALVSNVATAAPVNTNPTFAAQAQLSIGGAERLDLPAAMRGNLLDQQGQREAFVRSITIFSAPQVAALASIYSLSPDAWKPILNKAIAPGQQLAARDKWERIYPKVELLAQLNPHLTAVQLNTPWTGAGDAPAAVLRVTPRQKEMPQMKSSGFLKVWSWLGPVVSMIPIVGQVASVVGGIAAAQIQKSEIQQNLQNILSLRQPTNAFEPQYYPQPFNIVLPLDLAQLAANEPWYVEPIYQWFMDSAAKRYADAASAGVAAAKASPAAIPAASFLKALNPFRLA